MLLDKLASVELLLYLVQMRKTREHVRCPCCGRLAAKRGAEVLPAVFRPDHDLGGMTQTFTAGGQGAGFKWEPRELRDDEAAALGEVVAEVAGRLGHKVGDAAITSDTAEVARLRKRVGVLEKTLALAKIEIERLSGNL